MNIVFTPYPLLSYLQVAQKPPVKDAYQQPSGVLGVRAGLNGAQNTRHHQPPYRDDNFKVPELGLVRLEQEAH